MKAGTLSSLNSAVTAAPLCCKMSTLPDSVPSTRHPTPSGCTPSKENFHGKQFLCCQQARWGHPSPGSFACLIFGYQQSGLPSLQSACGPGARSLIRYILQAFAWFLAVFPAESQTRVRAAYLPSQVTTSKGTYCIISGDSFPCLTLLNSTTPEKYCTPPFADALKR